VDLNHIEDGLRAVDLLEIVNDFQNRWLGTIKVQARIRLKRVSPWRGDENDDEMIGRVRSRSHKVLITAVDEFDRPVEVRDIPSRQVEDGGLDLKTYTLGTGQVPQDRVQAVARACEWVDHSNGTIAHRRRYDLGNVTSDLVSERVFDGLKTSTRQDTDTALVPRLRWHAVEMDMVWVVERIAPVSLDFP